MARLEFSRLYITPTHQYEHTTRNFPSAFVPKFFQRLAISKPMASSAVTQWWLSLISWVVVVLSISKQATAQPQINLLNRGCSQYNATNIRNFFDNLNATFSDLRNQLSNESKLFATAQQSRSSDPVYAMVQCRNYLSNSDCLACYDAAVAQIRNCSAANGARVIYDGCFLR